MSDQLNINAALPDEEIYEALLPQIKSLLAKEDGVICNLANFTAALKEAFTKISWVGFYIAEEDKLTLGPFQGKVACTKIAFGGGVCGASAERKETIVVPNTELFEGHIACDSGSKSEIVVPLLLNGKVWGVLDLDSYSYNSFNQTDRKYLELLCGFLTSEIIY
jgi:L-methionine (R)-S-oxide reductase